jgi:hypothetical protein
MNWKELGRKRSWPDRGIPEFSLRDCGKQRTFSLSNQCSGQDSNLAHPEYKFRSTFLVIFVILVDYLYLSSVGF